MARPPTKATPEFLRGRKDSIQRLMKIRDFDQEVCAIVTLLPDYQIIADHLISIGGFYSNRIPIGVLIERAICDKARFLILGHNHPNGSGVPSASDIHAIIKLHYILDELEVGLVDSIIFPYGMEAYSIRSKYPDLFKKDFNPEIDDVIIKHIPSKLKE